LACRSACWRDQKEGACLRPIAPRIGRVTSSQNRPRFHGSRAKHGNSIFIGISAQRIDIRQPLRGSHRHL